MIRNSINKPTYGRLGLLLLLTGVLALLVACGGGAEPAATPTSAPTATPTIAGSNEPTRGQAVVNAIDILIMESFPVQVSVMARGDLPDSCTQIDEIITQQADNTFRVAVTTLRQPDQICTQALVPFEQSISLDVAGLPAGTYDVVVNGVTGSFTLEVDNVPVDDTTGACLLYTSRCV